MRLMRILLAAILPACCCFTCASVNHVDGTRSKYVTTGDQGVVMTDSASRSGGGLVSLVSGQSGGGRNASFAEASQPSSVNIGGDQGITISGAAMNSPAAGELWNGIGTVVRTIGSTKSIKAMFDSINTRIKTDGATDQLRSNNEARTQQAGIQAESKTRIQTARLAE